jgi:hypothetical protein
MRLASKGGIGLLEEQGFRWFRLRKRIRQYFRYSPGMEKKVLFIVGCQRSGTSMIHHLFRLDWDTVTYDEKSSLSPAGSKHFRWAPLAHVKAHIMAQRAPFVVAKPLVESQNLAAILDEIPESKALWMYRNYQDVARSNLKYFGMDTGHRDLKPIITLEEGNWRSEHVSDHTRDVLQELYSPDLPPHDAAALFWYARNQLFFSRGFVDDPRISLCCYEDLVSDPIRIMKAGYGFAGRPYPGDRITQDVFSHSKGKGRNLNLTPAIKEVCQELLDRLKSLPRIGHQA